MSYAKFLKPETFQVTEEEQQVLRAIFEYFAAKGGFPSDKRFRIDHEELIPVIDRIAVGANRYIHLEGDRYELNIRGLIACTLDGARHELRDIDSLVAALKSLYRADPYASQSSVAQIADNVGRTPVEVSRRLVFLNDLAPPWNTHQRDENGLITFVQLTENILRVEAFTPIREMVHARAAHTPVNRTSLPNRSTSSAERRIPMEGYESRWEIVKSLGEGGQGKVFLVQDNQQFNRGKVAGELIEAIRSLGGALPEPQRQDKENQLISAVLSLVRSERIESFGALKTLHKPGDARDASRAANRLKKEIRAMAEIQHPSILRILDHDPEGSWFVSEYCPNGTLAETLPSYKGELLRTLSAMREVVDAVAFLHNKGMIHRDIKPSNIFLGRDQYFVVADLGLVFFSFDDTTRVSDTFDLVGSRDWMPPWSFHGRIDEVRPSFDVYALGKIMWSMIAGLARLPLTYDAEEALTLPKLGIGGNGISSVDRILRRCVVQKEKDCIPTASEMLVELDRCLQLLTFGGEELDLNGTNRCMVCRKGNYKSIPNGRPDKVLGTGLNPSSAAIVRIRRCDYCGHTQLFSAEDNRSVPTVWLPKKQ